MSMARAVRVLILAAATAATLAACQRREEKAPAPAPTQQTAQVTPADAAAPFAFQNKTDFASVALTLPTALKTHPDLHAQLYSAAVRDLRQFSEGAQADLSEAGGGMTPYEKSIQFAPAFETAKLFSLSRVTSEFTGGAHPNSRFGAVLYDKALKRAVEPADFFRKGVDSTGLDRALCEAVNTEKRARGSTDAAVLGGAGPWTCPRATETPFVLAGGTMPGKAGGLTFLISPYQVDSYAAGPYEVTVPQAAFRALVAPAYADEFAGNPVKAPTRPAVPPAA
jgi:hypothetical protein